MNQTITTYFRLTEKEKHPSLKKKTESTPNPSSFAGSRPQNQEATADSHLELSILNKQRAGKRYVRIYRLFSLYYFRCMLYCFRCILNQYVIIFKKENCRLISAVFNMVEVTRFELATSSSRTKRATKLRHTSKNSPESSGPHGCGTRIRTQTYRVRVCCATLTQFRIALFYYNQNFGYVKCKIEKTDLFLKYSLIISGGCPHPESPDGRTRPVSGIQNAENKAPAAH